MVLLMRLALLALLLSGCFSVDDRTCTYACGPNSACPDDYVCMPDGYCHLHGNTNECGYPDAAMAPSDMSAAAPSSEPDIAAID
jgi:hypothetical protein